MTCCLRNQHSRSDTVINKMPACFFFFFSRSKQNLTREFSLSGFFYCRHIRGQWLTDAFLCAERLSDRCGSRLTLADKPKRGRGEIPVRSVYIHVQNYTIKNRKKSEQHLKKGIEVKDRQSQHSKFKNTQRLLWIF